MGDEAGTMKFMTQLQLHKLQQQAFARLILDCEETARESRELIATARRGRFQVIEARALRPIRMAAADLIEFIRHHPGPEGRKARLELFKREGLVTEYAGDGHVSFAYLQSA